MAGAHVRAHWVRAAVRVPCKSSANQTPKFRGLRHKSLLMLTGPHFLDAQVHRLEGRPASKVKGRSIVAVPHAVAGGKRGTVRLDWRALL